MRFLYDESHPVEDIRREDAEEGEEDMPIIWSLDREQVYSREARPQDTVVLISVYLES